MYIYSGKCRMGVCGEPTGFKDMHGKDLFVGDIVVTYCENSYGDMRNPEALTAIVSERFTSFADGTHIDNGPSEKFVMGIKTAWPMVKKDYEDSNAEEKQEAKDIYGLTWFVVKVKSWEDVIDGEKWTEYGFNYKED